MDSVKRFCYRPACSAVDCKEPAVYKLAATWSDGSSRELKNYGLTCEVHRDSQLAAARRHHDVLRLSDDETVGPVEVYLLRSGHRDTDLTRYADDDGGGLSRADRQDDQGP